MEAARAVPALPVPDRELLARAGRSPEVFAELYRRHYGRIGTYLLRRTGDRAATEDLLAEFFLAALRGVRREGRLSAQAISRAQLAAGP